MQLAIRNKWISLRGSSVVKDLEEKDILRVKGKFWTFTRKKFVQTLEGETKFVVRNRFWHFFVALVIAIDNISDARRQGEGNSVTFGD